MATSTLMGGPTLPHVRRLQTAFPGPNSLELAARKQAAVASGISVMMPVFAMAAGGGVVVDVDGNSLIDLGSGIAVTGIGNDDPAVVAAVADQVARFTHTCFMITGYEGYIEVAERLNRLTPGDHAKRTALFNSSTGDPDAALTTRVAQRTQGEGVIVLSCGTYGNVIRLLPPLTIPDNLLAEGLDVLLAALARS